MFSGTERGSVRTEPTAEKSDARSNPLQSVREYIKEVRLEMSKVSWPTREELRQHTVVVVVMVVLVAVFIGIIDRGLAYAFEAILKLVG